jgi:hypothetical protein
VSKENDQESFEEFKNSFSYGLRTDLNFKFLKHLSPQEAAAFFQDLLKKLGASMDDGRVDRLVAHVCEWQARGYSEAGKFQYSSGPFTLPARPVAESRLALLTSSGHFVEGHDPAPFGVRGMTQAEAMSRIGDFFKVEPELSRIPIDTHPASLRVRHGGYDISGAQADPNVVFPLQRLIELQRESVIGELAADAYSFIGAAAQTRILKEAGPKWVRTLEQEGVELALLVPA